MRQTEKACIAGALIGAATGATLGYFYATDAGGRRRKDLSSFVDRALVDVEEARKLWSRLTDAWIRFDEDRKRVMSGEASQKSWSSGGAA